jgi:deoxycytidylate deaminase
MLSQRWIRKYMRLAKTFGEDDNRCYSRHIGVVLVDPMRNKVLSMGLNGPPRKVPPCDSREYLDQIVWPQLNEKDRSRLRETLSPVGELREHFVDKYAGCGTCPRRLIGAKSGERLEICSCEHAEKNAIANASESLAGSWAFCWCGVACWDCAKLMINAGIKRAYFVDDGSYAVGGGSDYSFGSRWLFEQAGLDIHVATPDSYLEA